MSDTSAQLLGALVRLREALQHARLPLDLPGADDARTMRMQMVSQLEDYVLPRMVQLDAPLLTVVGGSTGAGKSTLVNSLVGEQVSAAGVLRPTTRSPVLVHHPEDAEWFDKAQILPDFQRTSRASADPGALQLVSSRAVPVGLAVLDAPDVDSVEQRNRELAAQLLDAADMWLFVTSAARYADQVPWDHLRQAAERSAAVAVVLDRTEPSAIDEVSGHLIRMLNSRGLRDSPLFTIAETTLEANGLLPQRCVEEIQVWLEGLAADADARSAVVRQTLGGAIRTITQRVHVVADAGAAQEEAVGVLLRECDDCYDQVLGRVRQACRDGTVSRGEPLRRWRELAGSGELALSLESGLGRVRDRISRAVRGRPQAATRVNEAVADAVSTLVVQHAASAAERVEAAWRRSASGRALLEGTATDLSRPSGDLPHRADRMVREWQQSALGLVRAEGADRRASAPFLTFGAHGLAATLLIVALAPDEGPPGPGSFDSEAASLACRLLGTVFEDAVAVRMARSVRDDLLRRIEALFDAERSRYPIAVDELGVRSDAADRMRSFARQIDDLRIVHGVEAP